MKTLLRKTDVVAFFGPTNGHTARAFIPIEGAALSKNAVRQWPEFVPELRALQLLKQYPGLQDLVVDPVTRLTRTEMRERLKGHAVHAAMTG